MFYVHHFFLSFFNSEKNIVTPIDAQRIFVYVFKLQFVTPYANMRKLIVLLVLSLYQVNGNDLDEYDLKEKLLLKYNRGSKPTEQTNVTINIQLLNLDFKDQVSHHLCLLKLQFCNS